MAKKVQVQMFGEFCLTNGDYTVSTTNQKGLQGHLLLAYLFANAGTTVTTDNLIDILWQDGTISDENGALRTLMFRAKKLLEPFAEGNDIEFIGRNNSVINLNYSLFEDSDITMFEKFAHMGFRESNPDLQYEFLTQAFDLYKGEFLPVFSHYSWVMFRNNYYGNIYIKCVNMICGYLVAKKRFAEMLDLCERAIPMAPPTDETVHRNKILALLYQDKTQTAMDYYYNVLSIFSANYSIDITDSMSDVYEAILNNMPTQLQSLKSLDETLRSNGTAEGSFYCNFDLFKNIFQIDLRSARRAKSRYYLILLTLGESETESLMSETLKDEMDILNAVMQKKLRVNDVYTKSSLCQFSLIVNTPNDKGAEVVRRRISEGYENKKKHPEIELNIDLKKLYSVLRHFHDLFV